MTTTIKKKTIRNTLNEIVRRPRKVEVTRLPKVIVVREKFKNKTLIEVGGDINPRFLKRI